MIMDNFICKYCGKICKNKNSLAQHEIRCKQNPNKLNIKSNLIEYNKSIKRGDITASNQYIKAKKLGLPKPQITIETRRKIGNGWRGKHLPTRMKEKISTSMQITVRENPESYSSSNINGRVKKVEYNGILLDSQWEADFAKYLDLNNIKWTRPKKGIEYIYNNMCKLYYPDFYLPDFDIYIEVKGYIRDKDIYKWKALSNLIIIKHKEIKDIHLNKFDLLHILNTNKGS